MSTEDQPRPACEGYSEPYDILVEHTNGPGYRRALTNATVTCAGCPLRDKCLRDNATEQWARAVIAHMPRPCRRCGAAFRIENLGALNRAYCSRACGKAASYERVRDRNAA